MRPKKSKCIDFYPNSTFFKPAGIPVQELKQVHLLEEEVEAMRLFHLNSMRQKEVASKMQIHQSTVQRLLKSGGVKVTSAIVNGFAIRLEKKE